jgi:two-component system, sensor histidine kinase and response regulator
MPRSKISEFFRRKELLLVVIQIIALLGLYGWLSGKIILASYSPKYIPIAPANIAILLLLSSIFFIKIKSGEKQYVRMLTDILVSFMGLFCLIVFLQYFLHLTWDIEVAFLRNPQHTGSILVGRMSPITSLVYVFICLGTLGTDHKNRPCVKYIGSIFSLLTFMVSSILLIGYLYKAPLLYGSKMIPVSLPAVLCMYMFSLTLLRSYESRYWNFNLVKDNKVTRLLLKSFLPVVVFIIMLQGFLITNFPMFNDNLAVSVSIALFIIIIATVVILFRISDIIGTNILNAEHKLIESEERIRSIMENSADAIFIADQKGRYQYTNMAASVLLGYSPEELKSRTIADLSPQDKMEAHFEIFNHVLNEGKAFAETELIKSDGNFIPVDLNAVQLPNGLVYGSCRDITERKKTEQELKDSDTKYRMIADYNYDWEFWLTNDNKFKYNSPSCERISGYKPEDFDENPDLIMEIIHPDDIDIYKKHFEPIGENESCDGIDFRIITSSGEVRWINHVCQPIFDDNGIHIGRRGSNCDITRRKHAEDLILKLNSELRELNLNKDRFVAILGHDLISPFNILLGMSDVLVKNIEKLETGKIQKFAVGINKAALSTYKLLEDILMWAKVQQGNFPFEPLKISLEDICNQTIELLTSSAEAKNIRMDISKTDRIYIFADIHMVRTILRNLILNAIKFTNKDGLIKVSAEQNHSKITITVSDNGIGIKPENLAKLFDITQVITTKGTAKEEGNGLGLILCKDFVEKHGGRIWAESKPGQGSHFRFTLPMQIG